jgi:hypothetical protein
MLGRVLRYVLRNWPIKLAALALALLLYARAQTQRPLERTFAVPVEVVLPPGRRLMQPVPRAKVSVTARGSDLLAMPSLPTIVTRQIPDTFSGAEWMIRLQPADVPIPSGLDVTVMDVSPPAIAVALSPVAVKTVRVAPRVRLVPESGLALSAAPEVAPAVVRLIGADAALAAIESVATVPVEIRGTAGPFLQAAAIDTTLLGGMRVDPARVTVSGEVGVLLERSIDGVPVESGAGSLTGVTVLPSRVLVTVRGPAARVRALTRDSVHVVAHSGAADPAAGYARLTVLAPPGIVARVTPDSVLLRRRGGGD